MLVKKERRRVSGGDGGTDMNERLAAALEQLPFWPNLTEPQRELARRGARLVQYDRGALVFQQLAAENIHVECCMYRLATERFSDVMWAMQQLLFTSFDKRLAQYLWDESDHARAPVRATHEQIARDTGAVRETVTRMLRHFADDGIVSLGRGTVTVTDAEKLRKLAGM